MELRRFFSLGIENAAGEVVAKDAVHDALKAIVAGEDKMKSLSDEAISEKLKAAVFPVARRTVAKYRDLLGILGTSAQRKRLAKDD